MRRRTLFSQVLLVNAVVTCLLVAGAALLLKGDVPDVGRVIAVAALAAGVSTVLNLVLLSRRFGPLEALIEDMEKVDLSRPGANLPDSFDGIGETEEVERIELAFLQMMRRLESERRRTSSAALMAQERERARVARDLHDEVNQSLTALLLRLEAARAGAPPELAAELDETKRLANQAMQELLTLARQLRPTALDDLGLEAAIAGLVEQLDGGEIEVSFEATGRHGESKPGAGQADRHRDGEPHSGAGRTERHPDGEPKSGTGTAVRDLPEDVQLVIYRVAQEALSNAARHSGAGRVQVQLDTGPDSARLTVRDDGRGFVFDQAGAGLGLAGMRERALLVGGEVDIESGVGDGTTVTLTVPLKRAAG